MENYIIIGGFIVCIYLLFSWLKNKYFKQNKYFNASKFVLLAVLISLFFSKKILEDFRNRDYFYLIIYVFLIGYFVYSFVVEMKKVKQLK